MAERGELVVIGAGPGGYVAALRASQLGLKVTLIEEDKVGGTCMNYGCIPTKFLLNETGVYRELKEHRRLEGLNQDVRLNWKLVQRERENIVDKLVRGVEFLLQRNGVRLIKGKARLLNEKKVEVTAGTEKTVLEWGKLILAAGSRPAELPFLKPDGREVITSREALELAEVPGTLLILGAGAIGLEIGTIYARLGVDVTILELLPSILPGSDRQMALRLDRLLKKQGLKILTEMRVEEALVEKGQVRLKGTRLRTQAPFDLTGEKVLLAAGRTPNIEVLGTEVVLKRDGFGFVAVNSRLETTIPGIYAIGDLIGGKLLAHKATHEGLVAAENAAGAKAEMDYNALPMAVFTEPEFASVGLTEEETLKRGLQARVGVFSLQANGRALTMGKPEGLVKVIADDKDKIVGAHLLAPHASEIIPELTLAIQQGLKLQDISSAIHIHPTLSEAVMEAALKAKGMAVHALNE